MILRTRGWRTYHRSHTPNIGTGAPFCAQDHLRRSVLPRLDIIREVVVNPARVAQISNLDTDDLEIEAYVLSLALLAGRR